MDAENKELLQEFKNLYAHDLPDQSNITVLKFLLKRAVQDKKKKLGLLPAKPKKDNTSGNALPPMSITVKNEDKTCDSSKQTDTKTKSLKKTSSQRKVLPVAVRRIAWQRANACCEYSDQKLKMRCNSKFALEPDHIVPLALGGTDEVSNLQLLCRVHNSRRAVKTFGIRK